MERPTMESFLSPVTAHIAASVVCTALGNAFQPIPILIWLQPFFLLRGVLLCLSSRPPTRWATARFLGVLLLLHALGSTFAMSSFFNLPNYTLRGVVTVFLFGVVMWALILSVCVLPHMVYAKNFPWAGVQPVVFPVCWAALWTLLSVTPLGGALNPVNNLVNDVTVVHVGSFFGIHGLTFLHGWVATAALSVLSPALCSSSSTTTSSPGLPLSSVGLSSSFHRNQGRIVSVLMVTLLALGGLRAVWGEFYQVDLPATTPPVVRVSCVLPTLKIEAQIGRATL
eukprot:RCo007701